MPQVQVTPQQKSILTKTGLIIVGLIVAYYLGTCGKSSDYEKDLAKWKHTADAALETNKLTQHFLDSLQTKIDSTDAKAAAQNTQIVSLKKQLATQHVPKRMVDSVLAQAPDTCKAVVEVAQKLQAENTTLTNLVVAEDSAKQILEASIRLRDVKIDTLTKQNATLANTIKTMKETVPVHKDPKLLWVLPYPNRKVSAVVGAVLGAGVTYAVLAPLIK